MKKPFWLLSIFLLFIICVTFFNYFYTQEKEKKIEQIISHQKLHAKQAVKSFRELFDKWNSVLFYLSNDENVILMNDKGKNYLMKLSDYLKGDLRGITRTDSKGVIIFTTPDNKNSIGVNISHQKHMVKILKEHKPVVSEVFETVQGYKAIVMHYPVFKKNNEFDGTIALLLNFEKISKNILDDIRIGKTGYAFLLSSEGVELYNPVPGHIGKSINDIAKGFPDLQNLAYQMLKGKTGILEYLYLDTLGSTGYIKKIAYYLPIQTEGTFWSLAITYSEKEITSSLINFRNRLFIVFIFIFIGGIWISYYGIKFWFLIKQAELKKASEIALRKEKTLLKTLIDNLPSGVFIKDENYRKIIFNRIHLSSMQEYFKYLGLNPEMDIENKTDFEILPYSVAQQYYEDDKKVIEENIAIINKEEKGFGPDGEQIWLLVSKVPLHDQEGKTIGLVGITTNITNRKKAEEELIRAKEKAEESDRLKTAFLNNISHEIRTPLNAILGFSQLLLEPDSTKEKINNYVQIINESSNHLLMIITDIINIATIEAGQVKINNSHFNINSIFPTLQEQFRWKANSKNINLSYQLALPDNEANIFSDYIKLVEILSNLINNALKFTENGTVQYGYKLKDTFLEFYVNDTGIGIKKEYFQQIFDRFFQAKENLIFNKGMGLGLSIALAYVKALGGEINVESKYGSGSTFYFTIPYKTE